MKTGNMTDVPYNRIWANRATRFVSLSIYSGSLAGVQKRIKQQAQIQSLKLWNLTDTSLIRASALLCAPVARRTAVAH